MDNSDVMEKQKIIMIGGGIGGLVAAIALNRKNIDCTLYEKAASHQLAGSGFGLWPNATGILHALDLLEGLLPYCNILDQIETQTSGGRKLNIVNIKKLEDTFHFPTLVLLRSDLHNILLERISPAQIHYGKEYLRTEDIGNGSVVHFSDGTTAKGDAIIFANGIHSTARHAIFNLPALKYANRISWRGIAPVDESGFAQNSSYEILGKGKRIGIFPLPHNQAYWYASINMNDSEPAKQQNTIENIMSFFDDWNENVKKLILSTPKDKLNLTAIKYAGRIDRLVSRNKALLGDAAHPITPDLGQGACQAIEDAFVLAECLSIGKTLQEGLVAYENKRLKRVNFIARQSFKVGKVKQLENAFAIALRNKWLHLMPESFVLGLLGKNIHKYS